MICPQDMNAFAKTAPPGSAAVYHIGLLAADRADPDTAMPRTAKEREINITAAIAWSLYIAGAVVLVQRKIDVGRYSYEMQKRRDPRRAAGLYRKAHAAYVRAVHEFHGECANIVKKET